jgi:endonuclease/exonuclease/phosphatase family metal-dependent hydrolase
VTDRSRRWWRSSLLLATALTALSAAIHLCVGDSNRVAAPVTYAAAWPLVLAIALMIASIQVYRRSWRAVGFCIIVLAVSGGQWVGLWGASPPSAPPGPACRILFWNAASPTHPSRALIDAVQDTQSDLIVLAESGLIPAQGADAYAHELPGYRLHGFPHEIMVLSKGAVTMRDPRLLPNRSSVRILECESPVGTLTLVVADLGSSPLADRKPIIAEVFEIAAAEPDAIVLGDFNTPYDSVTFDPFRDRYTHALKAARPGPIETWPYIFPCLAIDHVWLPQAFAVVSADKRWTVKSDHAMLMVRFARR